jgi:hypothetical protein
VYKRQVSTRVFLEKSLTKVLILSALSHSGSTMYFFSVMPEKSNDIIALWLAVNVLSTFYVFSVLRLMYRFDLGLAKDIRNLSRLRGVRSIGMTILFLMVVLVVFGIPTSLMFTVKEIVSHAYGCDTIFSNLYFAAKSINLLIGWKLLFSYFGVWGSADKTPLAISYRGHLAKTISLFFLGMLLVIGGWFFAPLFLSFFGIDLNVFTKSSVNGYLGAVGLCGVVYLSLVRVIVPNVDTEDRIVNLVMPIKNFVMFIYCMCIKLVDFFISNVDRLFVLYRMSARFLLKKSSIGIFSKLYGGELVLAVAVFIIFGMFFALVK